MKYYKRMLFFLLTFLITCTCSSCSLLEIFDRSSVDAFGNVRFAESGLIGCINWLYVEDELYYYVSSLDSNVEYDNAIGAFNNDGHGYTLYSLKGEEYFGITVLEEKTMMNTLKFVYASEKIEDIPCSLLYDIPHEDTWFNGGGNFTLNDITYSNYYSTLPNTLEKGEKIGIVNNITYYSIPGYDEWICSVNEADNERLNLHYTITMKYIPMYFIKLANPLNV